jgi:hypothetical protein
MATEAEGVLREALLRQDEQRERIKQLEQKLNTALMILTQFGVGSNQ